MTAPGRTRRPADPRAAPAYRHLQHHRSVVAEGADQRQRRAGGKILEGSTELSAATINQATPKAMIDESVSNGRNFVFTMYDVSLPTTVKSNAGATYDVVFTPQGNSVWAYVEQRSGAPYGFTSPAAFTELEAQVTSLGVWIDASHWAHSGADTRVMHWVTLASTAACNVTSVNAQPLKHSRAS